MSTLPLSCSGYEGFGSFVLSFAMLGGTQKPFHPTPGAQYTPTNRVAYFPANQEGVECIDRIVVAFERGHVFSVGTSLTTGMTNVIVFGSVHLKSAMSGGVVVHGWPDPFYFDNVDAELCAVGC